MIKRLAFNQLHKDFQQVNQTTNEKFKNRPPKSHVNDVIENTKIPIIIKYPQREIKVNIKK